MLPFPMPSKPEYFDSTIALTTSLQNLLGNVASLSWRIHYMLLSTDTTGIVTFNAGAVSILHLSMIADTPIQLNFYPFYLALAQNTAFRVKGSASFNLEISFIYCQIVGAP